MTDLLLPSADATAREAAAEQLPASLRDAIEAELRHLWFDLGNAIRDAIRGGWSMQCDNVATRIVTLTRMTRPTPWEQIPLPLLDRGIYQTLMSAAGVGFPEPDMRTVRKMITSCY